MQEYLDKKMKKILISPSILAANFKSLNDDILSVKNGGAEYLHFDVMDGKFVNNKTFDEKLLKEIYTNNYGLVLDVHLMVINPLNEVKKYIDNGADIITIHYEACENNELNEIIDLIHKYDKKVGVSIKPNTDVKVLIQYLDKIDQILIMSVEPGFGGQKFLDSSINKISFLDEYRNNNNLNYLIEVDGGINNLTSKEVIKAGVDILVSGTYIFKAEGKKTAIDSLRG